MGVEMRRKKFVNKLIPVLLVSLLLGTVLAPCVSSGTKQPQNKLLTIWMQKDKDNDYFNQIEIEQQQIDEINISFNGLMNLIEEAMNNDKRGSNGENITEGEWEDIKYDTYAFIALLRDTIGTGFPFWDCIELIGTVIGLMLGPLYYLRQPIFSIGFGFSVIPWYFYETFFGKLLRPMWITYFPGFTSTYHINPFPPRIPYCRIGLHRIRSMLYNGLYIDFSDLGHEKPLGIVLLIGYGFTGMA